MLHAEIGKPQQPGKAPSSSMYGKRPPRRKGRARRPCCRVRQVVGASKIARDISLRKRAEESQAALYDFTDRLFRAGSADDVYEAALDAIIHALGCERASILRFDDSEVMKFVAWRGLSDTYRQAVEGHSPWTRETKDPQPILVSDIEAAELDNLLKATIKAEGIAAVAFIPLTTKGGLIGKFMAIMGRLTFSQKPRSAKRRGSQGTAAERE